MKYSAFLLIMLASLAQAYIDKDNDEGKKGKGKGKDKDCDDGKKKCSGGGGDPHFRTLDGTLYSFHGECDVVMARSNSYSSGLGLELQARTKIVDDWSLISNVALRIGNDIIEMVNDGSHYYNGNKDVELPINLSGQYLVTKGEDMISTFEEDGSSKNVAQQMYTIHLMNEDVIRVSVFRSMITVNVVGEFEGTHGMLGTSGMAGLIGRDGVTKYSDPIQMGMDWQVNLDDEVMLFHDISGPQYPEQCIMPVTSVSRRRLRKYSTEFLKAAEAACADGPSDLQKLCLEDILRVGDVNIALGYAF